MGGAIRKLSGRYTHSGFQSAQRLHGCAHCVNIRVVHWIFPHFVSVLSLFCKHSNLKNHHNIARRCALWIHGFLLPVYENKPRASHSSASWWNTSSPLSHRYISIQTKMMGHVGLGFVLLCSLFSNELRSQGTVLNVIGACPPLSRKARVQATV